jgi:transposase
MCVAYKKRSEEELAEILEDYRRGMKFLEISQKYKIGESSFYRILGKYKGLNAEEIKKLRHQDKEIRRLKKQLKDREFENKILKEALRKKW